MEEQAKLTAFQELLTEAFLEYSEKHTSKFKRKVSDTEFAKFLGTSTGSFNQWINATRMPKDFENILKLAQVLGDEVFDIKSYRKQKQRFFHGAVFVM